MRIYINTLAKVKYPVQWTIVLWIFKKYVYLLYIYDENQYKFVFAKVIKYIFSWRKIGTCMVYLHVCTMYTVMFCTCANLVKFVSTENYIYENDIRQWQLKLQCEMISKCTVRSETCIADDKTEMNSWKLNADSILLQA